MILTSEIIPTVYTRIDPRGELNCPLWQNQSSTVTWCVMTVAILKHISDVLPEAFMFRQSVEIEAA